MIDEEIQHFFRNFALEILTKAQADLNNPKEVKMAMLDHYEEIYPAFAKTETFRQNNGTEHHEEMVQAYRECFSMLLMGRLP
ncbi:MAG: hypothetical protein ACOYJF_05545 [Prevotella sp.]|jgi:hypothetical protein